MSLETRHNRFSSLLGSVNLSSLYVMRNGLEDERREAIARGNGEHMVFCDQRLKIIELEIAKRESDDALR